MKSEVAIIQICFSKSWGGLEMVAFETALWLSEKEDVFIQTWCPSASELEKRLMNRSLEFKVFSMNKKPTVFDLFKARKYLNELKSKYSKVVIIGQQFREVKWIRALLLGHPDVKLVVFAHTFISFNKKDFVHRLIYQRIDQLIALTSIHKSNLLSHLPIEGEKIVCIPNSVNTDLFLPLKDQPAGSMRAVKPTFLIGVIGRFDPQKGQMVMLKALKILKDQNQLSFHESKLQVLFVGEDTRNTIGTKALMMDYIQQHGLSDVVELQGFSERPWEVYQKLDLFVMPSKAETFGRVLIEAMACKVAVMGTRAGGVPDIIDNERNGLLFEPENPQSLAEAILLLWHQPELRLRLAENGYLDSLRIYSAKAIEQKLSEVLF